MMTLEIKRNKRGRRNSESVRYLGISSYHFYSFEDFVAIYKYDEIARGDDEESISKDFDSAIKKHQ